MTNKITEIGDELAAALVQAVYGPEKVTAGQVDTLLARWGLVRGPHLHNQGSKTMRTELLPCPFCGINPKSVGVFGMAGAEHPMENDCYFRGATWPADRWNRRPSPVESPAPLTRLKAIEKAAEALTDKYFQQDGWAVYEIPEFKPLMLLFGFQSLDEQTKLKEWKERNYEDPNPFHEPAKGVRASPWEWLKYFYNHSNVGPETLTRIREQFKSDTGKILPWDYDENGAGAEPSPQDTEGGAAT